MLIVAVAVFTGHVPRIHACACSGCGSHRRRRRHALHAGRAGGSNNKIDDEVNVLLFLYLFIFIYTVQCGLHQPAPRVRSSAARVRLPWPPPGACSPCWACRLGARPQEAHPNKIDEAAKSHLGRGGPPG